MQGQQTTSPHLLPNYLHIYMYFLKTSTYFCRYCTKYQLTAPLLYRISSQGGNAMSTQLGFIHTWVITSFQWMMCWWWLLVYFGHHNKCMYLSQDVASMTRRQILKFSEHLHQCSVCDPAQQNWMKKIHRMPIWLKKMVLAPHSCAHCQWLVKGTAALCTCRNECNKNMI